MNTIEHAYRRFSTQRFPLPDPSALDELEARIKVMFPEDYRAFVLSYNGGQFSEPEIKPVVEGCPQDALTYLSGIGASHSSAELGCQRMMALFDDNDPPQIVPIGGTAMGGLLLMIVTGEESGSIAYKQAFGDFYCPCDGSKTLAFRRNLEVLRFARIWGWRSTAQVRTVVLI